jgi:DNA repair ATPase RecN
MDQYSPTSLYSIAEEVTPQDHGVLCRGGTSSNLERLPSRIQRSKTTSRSKKTQIEDLAYEASYLKAELVWHSESKQALLQLQEQMYDLFHRMEDALIQVTARLQEAEQRYLGLWGMTPNANTEGGVI